MNIYAKTRKLPKTYFPDKPGWYFLISTDRPYMRMQKIDEQEIIKIRYSVRDLAYMYAGPFANL